MIVALLCSAGALDAELRETVLYRRNVERLWARNVTQARAQAVESTPDIIVVDHALPEALRLVAELREDPHTRNVSIAIIARGDFAPDELEMLQAGANAILRLPPDPEWDDRLSRLIHVPVRREARFPIHLQVNAEFGDAGTYPAVVLNLSIHGMLVACGHRLQVGEDINFAFHLPERSGLIQGQASVVRAIEKDHYGIELTHVEEGGRQRIREFVDAIGAGSSSEQ